MDALRSMSASQLIMELADTEEELLYAEESHEIHDLQEKIAAIQALLTQKADKIDDVVDAIELEIETKEAAKRYYDAQAARIRKRIEALDKTREYLQVALLPGIINAIGRNGKLVTNRGTYTLRQHYSKVVYDEQLLDAKYHVSIPATYKIDGKTLRSDCIEALKSGAPLPAGAQMKAFKKGVRK